LIELEIEEMDAALVFRCCSLQPIIAIAAAPASANDFAMAATIPTPPPVMRTTLPLADSSGLVGEMVG